MPEIETVKSRPTDSVGRILYILSWVFALFGGLILCAMALLTTVSVIGRAWFDAPVTGDFELIAIGTGVAVFAFLPLCQLMRENVVVDIFLSAAPFRVRTFFDSTGNLIYGLIIALMAWRTSLGGIDMYESGEMSMILEFPRWWTFPVAVLCLLLLLAVCVYTLVRSINETRLNRSL